MSQEHPAQKLSLGCFFLPDSLIIKTRCRISLAVRCCLSRAQGHQAVTDPPPTPLPPINRGFTKGWFWRMFPLVAHDCGYPLSRYTCRATRVAADFLDFIAFCRCSSGVAPHPLKILASHLPPPPPPGGVAPKFGSEKVSRYTGVSQVQLRVSRYTVQLRCSPERKSDVTPEPGTKTGTRVRLAIPPFYETALCFLSNQKYHSFRNVYI